MSSAETFADVICHQSSEIFSDFFSKGLLFRGFLEKHVPLHALKIYRFYDTPLRNRSGFFYKKIVIKGI
tara:strand:- start:304 stop:510 length:207 start_codon:yes stop_codon:yes gene_type:complete